MWKTAFAFFPTIVGVSNGKVLRVWLQNYRWRYTGNVLMKKFDAFDNMEVMEIERLPRHTTNNVAGFLTD